MKITVPRLVAVGLVVAFLMGQAEQGVSSHHVDVNTWLGIVGDAVVVLVVVGLVMLASYLHSGHPLPGRAKPEPRPALDAMRRGRRAAVLAQECAAEIIKWSDGVTVGPSVELAEAPEGTEVPTLPAATAGTAHLELTGKGGGDV